jgi:hypothetical protein
MLLHCLVNIITIGHCNIHRTNQALTNVFSCRVADSLLNSHSTCPHCSTQESILHCFITAIFCSGTPVSKDRIIHISTCSLLHPLPSHWIPVFTCKHNNWQVMGLPICQHMSIEVHNCPHGIEGNEVIIAVNTKLCLRGCQKGSLYMGIPYAWILFGFISK